jgi:hypothetical protein
MITDVTIGEAEKILHREYPYLFKAEVERMAKHCRGEKWFRALLLKQPRSVGLSQGKDDLNVEEIGEREHVAEPGDDEEAKSASEELNEIKIKAALASDQLLLSSKDFKVQCMMASVRLALLRREYDPEAIAKHFRCSDETIRRTTKRVKDFMSGDCGA